METSNNSKIFKSISLLVTNADFINSQNEFFEKHAGTFTDSEENKHEYIQIFEAYVHILETLIDVELAKTFSPEDIKAFYSDFKANLKQYEEVNSSTVDTLYSFVDFDQFKAAILRYKVDVAKASSTHEGSG